MDSIETPITILTLRKELLEHALIYQQVVNSHSWTLAPANARHARMDSNSGLTQIIVGMVALFLAGKASQGPTRVSAGDLMRIFDTNRLS